MRNSEKTSSLFYRILAKEGALIILLLAPLITSYKLEQGYKFLASTEGIFGEPESSIPENWDQTTPTPENCTELLDFSPDSCDVSFQRWKLDNNIQNATMEFLIATDGDSEHNFQNFCSSLLAYLNNQATYLLQQAKLLTEVALEDKETFELLKAEYKIELSKFAEILDNLSIIQKREISTIENEFNSDFIQFKKNISYSLDQIDNLLTLKKKVILEHCVFQIRNGQYQSALQSFKKLNNHSLLTNVVTEAYGGNIENLSNAIKFIKISDSCDHQTVAYQALFDRIKTDNHLSHPNILYFSDLIEECVGVSLKNELEEFKSMKVKSLVYEFNLEKFNAALEFEKTFPTEEVAIRFSIYSILFDELERNNHLNSRELKALGYRMNLLDQLCETNTSDCKYVKPKLSALKTKFLNRLSHLLFDQYVTIESKAHEGYVLENYEGGFEVFTEARGNRPNESWLVSPIEDGKYIELKGILSGGKLFVSDGKVQVGSYDGSAGHWKLIPKEMGDYYCLESRENGKVLDASDLEDCTGTSSGYCSLPYTHEYSEGNPHQLWKFS